MIQFTHLRSQEVGHVPIAKVVPLSTVSLCRWLAQPRWKALRAAHPPLLDLIHPLLTLLRHRHLIRPQAALRIRIASRARITNTSRSPEVHLSIFFRENAARKCMRTKCQHSGKIAREMFESVSIVTRDKIPCIEEAAICCDVDEVMDNSVCRAYIWQTDQINQRYLIEETHIAFVRRRLPRVATALIGTRNHYLPWRQWCNDLRPL